MTVGVANFQAPDPVSSPSSINISSDELHSNYFSPVKIKFTFNPYTFGRKGKFYHNFVPFINSWLWLGNQLLEKGRELFD